MKGKLALNIESHLAGVTLALFMALMAIALFALFALLMAKYSDPDRVSTTAVAALTAVFNAVGMILVYESLPPNNAGLMVVGISLLAASSAAYCWLIIRRARKLTSKSTIFSWTALFYVMVVFVNLVIIVQSLCTKSA